MTRYLAAAAITGAAVNNIAEWVFLGGAAAVGAVALAGYVIRARRNGKRIAGHGVTLPTRKRRYSAAELADLRRDDIDSYWPAVKDMLPDCARDLPETPQRGET